MCGCSKWPLCVVIIKRWTLDDDDDILHLTSSRLFTVKKRNGLFTNQKNQMSICLMSIQRWYILTKCMFTIIDHIKQRNYFYFHFHHIFFVVVVVIQIILYKVITSFNKTFTFIQTNKQTNWSFFVFFLTTSKNQTSKWWRQIRQTNKTEKLFSLSLFWLFFKYDRPFEFFFHIFIRKIPLFFLGYFYFSSIIYWPHRLICDVFYLDISLWSLLVYMTMVFAIIIDHQWITSVCCLII